MRRNRDAAQGSAEAAAQIGHTAADGAVDTAVAVAAVVAIDTVDAIDDVLAVVAVVAVDAVDAVDAADAAQAAGQLDRLALGVQTDDGRFRVLTFAPREALQVRRARLGRAQVRRAVVEPVAADGARRRVGRMVGRCQPVAQDRRRIGRRNDRPTGDRLYHALTLKSINAIIPSLLQQ